LANLENMRTFMDDGTANVVLYPVAIVRPTEDSVRIAAASAWVASRAPALWFDFHLAIFESSFGGAGNSNANLADAAVGVGVPGGIADGIRNGDANRMYAQWVTSASQAFLTRDGLANDEGQRATPTVAIDGVRWFGDWTSPAGLATAVADASPLVEESGE
jgi:protein-disulfide isomerase